VSLRLPINLVHSKTSQSSSSLNTIHVIPKLNELFHISPNLHKNKEVQTQFPRTYNLELVMFWFIELTLLYTCVNNIVLTMGRFILFLVSKSKPNT
jgi:hypothetical protein